MASVTFQNHLTPLVTLGALHFSQAWQANSLFVCHWIFVVISEDPSVIYRYITMIHIHLGGKIKVWLKHLHLSGNSVSATAAKNASFALLSIVRCQSLIWQVYKRESPLSSCQKKWFWDLIFLSVAITIIA